MVATQRKSPVSVLLSSAEETAEDLVRERRGRGREFVERGLHTLLLIAMILLYVRTAVSISLISSCAAFFRDKKIIKATKERKKESTAEQNNGGRKNKTKQ